MNRLSPVLLAAAFVLGALTAARAGMAAAPAVGGCSVFPADDVRNTPIDKLPRDAGSDAYVTTIGAGGQLKADFGAGLSDGGPIGIPSITVPGTQAA
jgi:hypothetical protein